MQLWKMARFFGLAGNDGGAATLRLLHVDELHHLHLHYCAIRRGPVQIISNFYPSTCFHCFVTTSLVRHVVQKYIACVVEDFVITLMSTKQCIQSF